MPSQARAGRSGLKAMLGIIRRGAPTTPQVVAAEDGDGSKWLSPTSTLSQLAPSQLAPNIEIGLLLERIGELQLGCKTACKETVTMGTGRNLWFSIVISPQRCKDRENPSEQTTHLV